jgi:hypothetical protein
MIFTSLGLLVVGAVLLFVGIAKSSLPPLILSLVCTIGAGALLYASFLYYRKKAIEEGRMPADDGAGPGFPMAYNVPSTPATWTPTAAPGSNGGQKMPVDGWDDLNVEQASTLVTTLNLDELHAVRRYEVEHANRKTLLSAIDGRIDSIVDVRRTITNTD